MNLDAASKVWIRPTIRGFALRWNTVVTCRGELHFWNRDGTVIPDRIPLVIDEQHTLIDTTFIATPTGLAISAPLHDNDDAAIEALGHVFWQRKPYLFPIMSRTRGGYMDINGRRTLCFTEFEIESVEICTTPFHPGCAAIISDAGKTTLAEDVESGQLDRLSKVQHNDIQINRLKSGGIF